MRHRAGLVLIALAGAFVICHEMGCGAPQRAKNRGTEGTGGSGSATSDGSGLHLTPGTRPPTTPPNTPVSR